MDSPPLASAGQDVSVLLLLVVLVLLDVLSPWILSLKVSSVRPPGPAGVWALSTPVGFLHFVAFPVPMRMLHDRGDRRLFLGQMGLTLSVQFELALNALFASDPEDNVRLFRFFLYVMYFMVIALFFWPVFLSGSQLHRRVGRVFGLLYAVVLVAYNVANAIQRTAGADYMSVGYYLGINLPSMLCGVVIFGYYGYLIFWRKTTKSEGEAPKDAYEEHVKSLLKTHRGYHYHKDEPKYNFAIRWFCRNVYDYKNTSNFRYPTRFMTAIVMLVLTAYLLTVFVSIQLYAILVALFPDGSGSIVLIDGLQEYFFSSLIIVAVGAFVFASVQILQIMQTFKDHTIRLRKGDYSFIPGGKHNNGLSINDMMKFIGFSISFALFGYLWMFVILWIIVTLLWAFFSFPLAQQLLMDFLFRDLNILPFATVLAFNQLQYWIVRLIFTEKGDGLMLRRRKWFAHAEYFFIFINVLRGLFAFFFSRFVLPLLGSIMFSFRMDKRMLPDGLESMDSAHTSYLAMLLIDHVHNNPVVSVAVRLMTTNSAGFVEDTGTHSRPEPGLFNRDGATNDSSYALLTDDNSGDVYASSSQGTAPATAPAGAAPAARKARIRWHLALTLVNNPQLSRHRKHLKDFSLNVVANV